MLHYTSGVLSETKKLQLEWWTYFRDALETAAVVPSVQTPKPYYWYNVSVGRTGFVLSCIADSYADRIGVRLYMRSKYGASVALARLLEEKDAIEQEVGNALDWDASPDANDKTIASIRDGSLEDRDSWSEYAEWLVREVGAFRKAFSRRLKEMDLNDAGGPADETEESE